MKKAIVLSVLLTLSLPALARQLGPNDNGLKEFYLTRSFKDVSESVLSDTESSPQVEKLVTKVGSELTKRFNEKYSQGESEPINFDFCSSKCNEYGAKSKLKAKLDIGFTFAGTEESKQCQKVCKAYQLESNAYIDGIRYSERQKKTPEDCTGATVSTGRNISKEKVFDAINNEMSHSGSSSIQK